MYLVKVWRTYPQWYFIIRHIFYIWFALYNSTGQCSYLTQTTQGEKEEKRKSTYLVIAYSENFNSNKL